MEAKVSAKGYLMPLGHQISQEGRSLAPAEACSFGLQCNRATDSALVVNKSMPYGIWAEHLSQWSRQKQRLPQCLQSARQDWVCTA